MLTSVLMPLAMAPIYLGWAVIVFAPLLLLGFFVFCVTTLSCRSSMRFAKSAANADPKLFAASLLEKRQGFLRLPEISADLASRMAGSFDTSLLGGSYLRNMFLEAPNVLANQTGLVGSEGFRPDVTDRSQKRLVFKSSAPYLELIGGADVQLEDFLRKERGAALSFLKPEVMESWDKDRSYLSRAQGDPVSRGPSGARSSKGSSAWRRSAVTDWELYLISGAREETIVSRLSNSTDPDSKNRPK